ncbi:MAG: LysR family transcriptional regulator [Methylocystis sp.]
MNITQIRHFLKLTESLNFTSAARAAGVTQPTLTRSIQRLEEQLGGLLLYRDGKDTRLTALGVALRVEFEAILRAEESIHGILRANKEGFLDKLSLGIVSSIAPMRFARFIRRAMEQLSRVEIVLHPISRGSGIELVLAGTLDGCIIGEMPERNIKLDTISLFEERLLLACAKDHRLAKLETIPPHELTREVYIDRLNCEFREQVIKFLSGRESLPTPKLRSEREDWLQEVVASGGGVCMLPEHSRISQEIVLRPVEGLALTRDIAFVTVSGSGNSQVLQDFRRLLSRERWAG